MMGWRACLAAVRALVGEGFEVVIPRGQVCCGVPVYTAGDRDDALDLAEANIRAFRKHDLNAVVLCCASGGLALKKDHSAAVVKLPVTLAATAPVNVNVRSYDATAVRLVLNGQGAADLRVTSGEFPIAEGATYCIQTDGSTSLKIPSDGSLVVPLRLDGPVTLIVGRR